MLPGCPGPWLPLSHVFVLHRSRDAAEVGTRKAHLPSHFHSKLSWWVWLIFVHWMVRYGLSSVFDWLQPFFNDFFPPFCLRWALQWPPRNLSIPRQSSRHVWPKLWVPWSHLPVTSSGVGTLASTDSRLVLDCYGKWLKVGANSSDFSESPGMNGTRSNGQMIFSPLRCWVKPV